MTYVHKSMTLGWGRRADGLGPTGLGWRGRAGRQGEFGCGRASVGSPSVAALAEEGRAGTAGVKSGSGILVIKS